MTDILKAVLYTFAAVGLGCTLIVIYELLGLLKDNIIDYRIRQKSKRIIKHRFSKPPIAKCYCIDCKQHNMETNLCYRDGRRYTADTEFCSDAEPKKIVEAKENKNEKI